MKKIKVRFAPSPTGYLHVGSARTALFNWLFARHHGGSFMLRIEDTDLERSNKGFLSEILESLKWLGLDWDGEPVFQSHRFDRYREAAGELVKKDLAYSEGPAVVFKNPRKKIIVTDLLRGQVEFDGALMDDLVLLKSDGSPTYNFACVMDDSDMGMTHIIRGDDHLSNTPKQVMLYQALELPIPQFVHIPLILGEDRSRLSKRHGAASIREYREAGYLSQALVNYLALLGWSPGENQELISREELIKKFDVERVLKTGAVFSIEKLNWMNGQYIRQLDVKTLSDMLALRARDAGFIQDSYDHQWFQEVVSLFQERIFKLTDFIELSKFMFTEDIQYDEEAARQYFKKELGGVFRRYAEVLSHTEPFDHDTIEKKSRELMKELGMSGKVFIHPARVAVTGRSVSPSFFQTVALIGKQKAVERLRKAADYVSKL